MRSALRLGYGLWLGSFGTFCVFGAGVACTSNGSATVTPQAATPGDDDGGPGTTTDGPTSTTEDGSASHDGSQDGSSTDAGADVEQPLTIANEVEPNGGQPASAVNAMVLPGTMNGKIDPANDVDIFSIQLAPGDFWEWTATPTSADLAPHLIIFDTNGGMNPNVAGFAAAGATAKVQHFVLSAGAFVAGVRDARNVPTATGKGGPTYGYALTGKRKAPAPIAVTFPVIKQGKLASIGSVDLYTFTGTGGKGFDVFVRAPNAASTIDSRLSIFDIPAKTVIGINDDVPATPDTRDTQLGGASPANSTYMVVVENEGTNGVDLSYEIEFKLR
jgi:hypothetical protein